MRSVGALIRTESCLELTSDQKVETAKESKGYRRHGGTREDLRVHMCDHGCGGQERPWGVFPS